MITIWFGPIQWQPKIRTFGGSSVKNISFFNINIARSAQKKKSVYFLRHFIEHIVTCCCQPNHVARMSIDIDIRRSNLMSVIDIICQVLSTRNMSRFRQDMRHMLNRHYIEHLWAQKRVIPNFQRVIGKLLHVYFPNSEWSMGPPWPQCTSIAGHYTIKGSLKKKKKKLFSPIIQSHVVFYFVFRT